MNNIAVTSIKRGMGLLIPLSLLILFVAGCGASLQEIRAKESLERARAAYTQAKANPNVEAYAKGPLADAGRIIQAAEQSTDFKEMEHLGYLAEKKSQMAMTITEGKTLEKEIETLNKEAADVLMQKRLLEAKLAKTEAEAKAREAEQAKRAAAREAAAAERSKKEAEQSRALALSEAEKAERLKSEAEARAREAEQSRLLALSEAEKAERSKKEAEQSRLAALSEAEKAERSKKEAEQARLAAFSEAEKAERSKKEAEQARLEAEAKAREAEQTRAEIDQFLKELSELQGKMTERGIVLTMSDVLFAFGKAELASGAVRNVDKLAEFLEKHPERNVLIEGHTDSVGSDEFNLTLSQKRADAVKETLVAKGISPDRLLTKGYGKQFPVASNDTESGRQLNRRVEVLILDEGVDPKAMVR